MLQPYEKGGTIMETSKTTLTEKAYNHLLDSILSCNYMPGQELYEKQLNEILDFGRTPIREALLILKNEDLIDIFPRKGMRVKPITSESINNIYQIRKIIEPNIAVQFKSSYPKETFTKYQHELERLEHTDQIGFYKADLQFHFSFIKITNNKKLIDLYNHLMKEQLRLAMYAAIKGISNTKDNGPQHMKIINAMLTENDQDIRESIIYHLNHSLITSLKTLD